MKFDKNKYVKQRYKSCVSNNQHFAVERYYKGLVNLQPDNVLNCMFLSWKLSWRKTKIVLQKHMKQEAKYMLNKFSIYGVEYHVLLLNQII